MMYFRLIIVLILFPVIVFSQSPYRSIPNLVTGVATSAANWLKIESGVRGVGMGGAQAAAGIGVSSIPFNPASLTFLESDQEIYYSKVNYLAGISHNTIAYGRKMTFSDYFGVHLFYLNSGSMEVTTLEEPDGTGEDFYVTNYALRLVYGKLLTDRLRIAGSLKYIREDIYTMSMQSLAFDIGSNFDTGIYGLVLGMSVSNFGPNVQFHGEGLEFQVADTIDRDERVLRRTEKFPLPLIMRLGLKKDVLGAEEEQPVHKVMVSMDAINPIDYVLYSSVGAEYIWRDMLFVRTGTHLGHDTAGFTFGGGIKWNLISVDYAYVNYGVLKETHQFGLSFGL